MINGKGLTTLINPRDYSLDNEDVIYYAKWLKDDGQLKTRTLSIIIRSLLEKLSNLKQDPLVRVESASIDAQTISRLERDLESVFNQEFWETAARAMLTFIVATERWDSVLCFDDLMFFDCAFYSAEEILEHLLQDSSVEGLQALFGQTEVIKDANHKLSKLQKEILEKTLEHQDIKTWRTCWCPEQWFGTPAPSDAESKRVAWARAIQRLEDRQLIVRETRKRTVTYLRLTALGWVVAKRLQEMQNGYEIECKPLLIKHFA